VRFAPPVAFGPLCSREAARPFGNPSARPGSAHSADRFGIAPA
jgi:hypothetical protein